MRFVERLDIGGFSWRSALKVQHALGLQAAQLIIQPVDALSGGVVLAPLTHGALHILGGLGDAGKCFALNL